MRNNKFKYVTTVSLLTGLLVSGVGMSGIAGVKSYLLHKEANNIMNDYLDKSGYSEYIENKKSQLEDEYASGQMNMITYTDKMRDLDNGTEAQKYFSQNADEETQKEYNENSQFSNEMNLGIVLGAVSTSMTAISLAQYVSKHHRRETMFDIENIPDPTCHESF